MKISEQLKRNLLADVENICELKLDKDTKESLMRCFEITIATHKPEFSLKRILHKKNESKCKHGFELNEVLSKNMGATCKICGKKLSELADI